MEKIRTRFAPSPTGRMHVGNLRTALYAYLIAKHEDGDFLLRIEDTDQERQMEGAEGIIYRTLEKTGLIHDEGPDKDGGYGPYVQSERQKAGIYMEYAKKLVERGEAYYCFCTQERLDSLKKNVNGEEIMVYDKHCLSLSKEEVEANLKAGMPFVIRQNNPREGSTTFHDEIYGDITVDNSELDDMVLIKSDGYPTYNFANVVDDHLMKITHVVRGNEYLSSSPKYNRLYEAFGWEVPVYVHCPTITNEEHKKLSKRSGHSSFEDLIEQGFLTEAVVNFVALLGWSPSDNQEFFTLEELVKAFDYHNISKSPAVFDMTKLRWMNGEYMKKMDFDRFYELAEPYLKAVIKKPLDLKKIAAMVKTRIEVFPDIAPQIDFFEELPEYDPELYVHKKMKTTRESSLETLREVLPILEAQEDYSNDALYEALSRYVTEKGVKTGFVMWPIRIAVSGKQMTPAGATEILEVLGKEESLKRIQKGIELLSEGIAD
ncbi:MAG TPA: glutamate--tRNA ligase [Candidatus Copromonas avistercoris]|nr:glutamate--tRNA ligase [Candidatus Copromonas avistercoris]